jgi:hypothetical protein
VAFKVLPFASTLDERQLRRFKNGAHAGAQLHHQGIVPKYATDCERGVHYYAMQFIESRTLATLIAELRRERPPVAADSGRPGRRAPDDEGGAGRPGPAAPGPADGSATGPYSLSPLVPAYREGAGVAGAPAADTTPRAAAAATERSTRDSMHFLTAAQPGVQAAEALEHAQRHGVVHRDVKPANLLVDPRGHLWVTDFGLAHVQSQAGLTMTGDLLGTLRYMSPEQALVRRVIIDHRTDVCSLGAALYELLTLEPAFAGRDRQELLKQIAFEEPKPLRRVNKAVPAELETIVLKALEKNPNDRYATAQEPADDLRPFLDDRPIRARRPSLAQRLRKWSRRHRAVVAATVVSTIVALALGTGLVFWQWRVAEERRKQAERAEAAAKKAAAQLKAVNDFVFEDLLDQASPLANPVGAQITIRELLDKAAQKVAQKKAVAGQAEVEATIRHVLGNTYDNLSLFNEARRHLARALDIRRRVLSEKHPETLGTRTMLASNAAFRGRLEEAVKLYSRNLVDLREVMGTEDEATLNTMTSLANTLQTPGQTRRGRAPLSLSVRGRPPGPGGEFGNAPGVAPLGRAVERARAAGRGRGADPGEPHRFPLLPQV